MVVHDWGKLALLCLAILSAVFLLATASISESAGVGILTGVVGYLTGNGRLVSRREPPSPTISSRRRRTDHQEEEGRPDGP